MSVPTLSEVAPKALAREGLPAAPAAGSKEALALTVGKIQKEQGGRAAMEHMARREPIDGRKIQAKQEEIGVDRDPATGRKIRRPGSDEERRYNAIKTEGEVIKKFLENGVVDAKITARVLTEARLRPQLAAEIAAMTPGQQRDFLKRILSDPKFLAHVRENLDKLTDPQNPLADAVTPALDALEDSTGKRDNKQTEVNGINGRLASVNTRLAEFARPVGRTPGVKADKLDRLKAALPANQRTLRDKQNDLQGYQQRLAELTEERQLSMRYGAKDGRRAVADIEAEMNPVKTEVRNAQAEVGRLEADIQGIAELEQEERTLEDQKTNLDKEFRERGIELKSLQTEVVRRQREYEDAKALRSSHEQDFVSGFENIVNDATNELFNEQTAEIVQLYDQEAAKLKEQAKDQDEKALFDAFQERWLGPVRTRRGMFGIGRAVRYRPIDRNQVDNDFLVLMANGPDAVMNTLITTRINPATGANYTAAEAADILSNKEYADKMRPEFMKQLLGRRLLTSGLQQEDVHIIANTPWGKGMITQAIESNKAFRDELALVMGEGALNRPDFGTRFAYQMRKHPNWLQAIFMSLLPLGAAMYGIRAAGQGIGEDLSMAA